MPVQTNMPPAPDDLLKIIRCCCKTNCDSKQCTCRRHGLDCSLGCGECEELLIKVREKEEVLNRKHQIVYVSNEKDKRKIIEFIRNKNINIDTSKVYIDQRDSFENFFNLDFVVNFPTICLYNANNNTKTIIKEIDNLY